MGERSTTHTKLATAGPPLLVAVLASMTVFCSVVLDRGLQQPGITLDESFNVQQGVRLVHVLPEWIRGRLTLREAFGDSDDLKPGEQKAGYHLPDHSPLGRLWLGVWHQTMRGLATSAETDRGPFITSAARSGSAVAFGLTVFLVGWCTARWSGPPAGFIAAVVLVLCPRVFGHAHLAALETVMNLTFTAAVFSIAALWRQTPPNWKHASLTGLLFGLALLTKMQAVLIPVPVALWAVWRYRWRAAVPLAIWGGVAFLVFFAGWPWLWIDPVEHLTGYLGQAGERVSLNAFYFGTSYPDRAVPWHYPAVMFLVTVPLAWMVLGAVGCLLQSDDEDDNDEQEHWRRRLLGAVLVFPLVLFAVPGVVVYDGVRLFLVVFPLWAVLAGRGAKAIYAWAVKRWRRSVVKGIGASVIVLHSLPLLMIQPCYLSSYNLLTGGLWGAEKWGFETTYWGEAVTDEFLSKVAREVPGGETVHVAPVLHQFYLAELKQQSPVLRRSDIRLQPFEPGQHASAKYVLIFRRRADLPALLEPPPSEARLLASVRRQGVILAGLYVFPSEQ